MNSLLAKTGLIKERAKNMSIMVKVVKREIIYYIRNDLKEIVFPSSLPDPPGFVPPPKITLRSIFYGIKEGTKTNCASWVRVVRADIWRNQMKKMKKAEEEKGRKASEQESEKAEWSNTLDELGKAARKGGMAAARPILHRLYMTKASTYKDALQSFVEGYMEGIKVVREKNDSFFQSGQKPEKPLD